LLEQRTKSLVEVDVVEVTYSPSQRTYVVVLRERDSERWLPIFVGPGEAQAIALNLRGHSSPRPLTFDLLTTIIQHLDGQIRRVAIVSLQEAVYFAEVELVRPDRELIRIDARPSDVIPLALRLGIPIQIERSLFDAASQSGAPQIISEVDRIHQLEQDLRVAVEREDYESAARLRDEIHHLREILHPGEQENLEPHDDTTT
jgi:uncharacterized protein